MQTITLKVGSAPSGRDYATVLAAWNAIPADLVAADVSYVIEVYNDGEYTQNTAAVLQGKTTDPTHTINVRPAAGHGFVDNPNVLTNALRYNPANGVAFKGTLNNLFMFDVRNPYTTFEGFQFDVGAVGTTQAGAFMTSANNVVVQNCLVEYSGSDSRSNIAIQSVGGFAVQLAGGIIRNTLIVLKATYSYGVRAYSDLVALGENITVVRLPSLARGQHGFFSPYGYIGNKTFKNCAVFGADFTYQTQYGYYDHCASDAVIGVAGAGHLSNVSAANVFVDPTYDLRLKAGAPLIDAGAMPGITNLTTISGNRQMGTSADIGAWEYPQAIAAPTSKITKITVTGNQVKVDGTYTGQIDSARVSLLAAPNVTGNNAVSQVDAPATFGSGTFSVTFTGCRVGLYTVAAYAANAAYTTQAVNDQGGVEIVGGKALSVVQDAISGQAFTVHGTCSNANSGTLMIPAAANNPNGAISQSLDLTINKLVTPNTFTVTTLLDPGSYDPGVLTFTNADGTSLPFGGTAAVTILGISGYPQSTTTNFDPVPVATVTSVVVTPNAVTGSSVFSAVVNGTNNPSQGVAWSVVGGGSITADGVFTAPAATGVDQVVTIKATSLIDPAKFGTATATIAAQVVVEIPPDTLPTVTGVSLASFSNALLGGSQYTLSAVVQGTNSPSQDVTWQTTLGTITAGGILTAPAATNALQQGQVTATSVADPTKSASTIFSVAAAVVIPPPPDPTPTPTPDPVFTGEGTLVEFHFITPENLPIANSRFEVQLKAADFTDQVDGVMMPRLITGMTDVHGKQVLELVSCDTPYYAIMEDPVSEAGLVYLFYVPDVPQPTVVRLQDIVIDSVSTPIPIDQAILAQILEAKGQVLAAKAAIDAKFDALAGPNGSTMVGHGTGTVATALNALSAAVAAIPTTGGGGGSGGGTGNGAVMGEVMIPNTTAAQLARIDGKLGNLFTITLDANLVIPPVKNPVPGTTYSFLLQQDQSGGRSVTLDNKYLFENNTPPVFNTSPNMLSYVDGIYSSLGFFFCKPRPGTYAVTGLARIGSVTYETVATAYTALTDGGTVYVTRDGQLAEVITAMTRTGTFTVAGAPELGSIPKLHMDKTVRAAWGKGLFNIESGIVTIRDLWFDGAVNADDETISGVRYNGGVPKLLMQRVKTTNCNNGQLAGVPTGDAVVPLDGPNGYHVTHIDCEFNGNGITYKTGPNDKGQAHNIYLNHGIRYYGLRNKYLNAVEGHDFKTRAVFVLLDRCLHEGAMHARELDVPNGGVIHAVNTIFRKRPGTSQGNLIGIGLEGNLNPVEEYIFRNCVLDNSQGGNYSETWLMQAGGSTVPIKFIDCVFIGSDRTVISTPQPYELYYTGGPIGPEGWDQTVRGITPKWGLNDSTQGNQIFAANLQPQPQVGDPTLVAFPPTGSSATPSVRDDLDQIPH